MDTKKGPTTAPSILLNHLTSEYGHPPHLATGQIVPFVPKASAPNEDFDQDARAFEEKEARLFLANIALLVKSTDPKFIKMFGQRDVTLWYAMARAELTKGTHSELNPDAAFLRVFGEIAREEMAFALEQNKRELEEGKEQLRQVKEAYFTMGKAEGMTEAAMEAVFESEESLRLALKVAVAKRQAKAEVPA